MSSPNSSIYPKLRRIPRMGEDVLRELKSFQEAEFLASTVISESNDSDLGREPITGRDIVRELERLEKEFAPAPIPPIPTLDSKFYDFRSGYNVLIRQLESLERWAFAPMVMTPAVNKACNFDREPILGLDILRELESLEEKFTTLVVTENDMAYLGQSSSQADQ